MAVQIQMRRDVAADWTSANPVLAEGELGLETDTAKWKIGDGATAWTSLGYVNQVVAGPASVSNSGASPALTITNTGSGYSLLVEDSASTDSTPFVINASGNVGIGVTAPAGNLNISSDTAMVQRNEQNSTDAVGSLLQFFKRRGTKGSPTIVASGDAVGVLDFRAYDGTTAQQMALIAANVDGTPGAGDMPGRLSFLTSPDGSATPVERMRIDSSGNAHFGSAFNGSSDLNVSDGTTYLGLNISGAVSYVGNTSNHPLALITNNTERMRIDNAGLITGTGSSLGAWTAYTPTASAGSGTATTVTAAGRYTVIGKTCTVTLSLAITNKGTAGGAAVLTLPFNAASGSRNYCGSGRENAATGGALQVIADPGGDAALIFLANGGTPWVDTYLLLVTMTYEIA